MRCFLLRKAAVSILLLTLPWPGADGAASRPLSIGTGGRYDGDGAQTLAPENRGTWRLTTPEERQDLLLHELLHIALDKNDDEVHGLEACPLRRLAVCSARAGSPAAGGG